VNDRLPKADNCSFCKRRVLFGIRVKTGQVLCYGCRACLFFERHLSLAEDFAGKPFNLIPWQREFLMDIFGTIDPETGLRRYQDVYLRMAKKNAKTTFVAGLAVYALATATVGGTRVFGAATAIKQARYVFDAAATMVRHSPMLSEKLKVIDSTARIVRRDFPDSSYTVISADGDINDGMNGSITIQDELHRWRTRKSEELYEILKRGSIARVDDLHIDITTAGEKNESPLCYGREEYCDNIENGVTEDKAFYFRRWQADLSKYAWDSRAARVAANPSHEDNGGYLKDAKLEALCVEARNDPRKRSQYFRYNLDIWIDAVKCDIDLVRWAENHGGFDLRKDPIGTDDLIGLWSLTEKPCIAGVDLSSTTDLTALVLAFPPVEDGDQYTILPFFWMPEARVRERELRDKVPYSQWIKRGFITATPGESVDYRSVAAKIRWAAQMFELREVVLDPWNSRQLSTSLIDEGFTCVELRQGFQSLSGPTKLLLSLYLDRKLRHANHPVLYWNASCLSLKNDGNDNVRPSKPDRSKDSKRIDGIAALVNALSRCSGESPGKSVYADEETALI
jgi:phage terminase large subunit-like protein